MHVGLRVPQPLDERTVEKGALHLARAGGPAAVRPQGALSLSVACKGDAEAHPPGSNLYNAYTGWLAHIEYIACAQHGGVLGEMVCDEASWVSKTVAASFESATSMPGRNVT